MPPDNGGYMVAGYVVTAIILAGYAGMLWRKWRSVNGKR
jgi:hypothetical protein